MLLNISVIWRRLCSSGQGAKRKRSIKIRANDESKGFDKHQNSDSIVSTKLTNRGNCSKSLQTHLHIQSQYDSCISLCSWIRSLMTIFLTQNIYVWVQPFLRFSHPKLHMHPDHWSARPRRLHVTVAGTLPWRLFLIFHNYRSVIWKQFISEDLLLLSRAAGAHRLLHIY